MKPSSSRLLSTCVRVRVRRISRGSQIVPRGWCRVPKRNGTNIYGRRRRRRRINSYAAADVIPPWFSIGWKTFPRCARVLWVSRDTFARAPYPTLRITRKFSRDRAHEWPHRSRRLSRRGVTRRAKANTRLLQGAKGQAARALGKKARVAYFRSRATFAPFLTPLFRIIS